MTVHIVRLGSPRIANEGTRIGSSAPPAARRSQIRIVSGNWYDVWFPNLSPSASTVKAALTAETPAQWKAFEKKFRAEMAVSENARTLDVLAALSKQTNFSVGCYCEDESRCHRSILRALLEERGAKVD